MVDYTKKVLSGSVFIFVIGILSAFIAFIFRIVLARNLSLEEFGLFYAVFVFVGFFTFLRNFGWGASLIKYIPEFKVKGKYDSIKSTIIITSTLRIIFALVVGLVFFILSDFLANNYFHDPSASLILKLLSIFFILSVFVDITRNLLEAFQKPFWFPFVDFLKNFFVLVLVLGFFYFGLGILSPVIAYLIIAFILPILFLPVILRSFNFSKYKITFSKELVKKFFLFGLPFIFISTAAIVIAQVDTLLLTYFRTLEEVGVYNVVLPISLLLLQFSNAISVILFPMCSELWAKGDKEKLIKVINFIYKYSFIFVIPIGLLIFSFAPSLLQVFFGEEYVVGSLAMRILLIGVILYTIANVNQYILAGIGKPKITAKIVIIVALFNFLGNLVLIPIYGIVGAAIMTTLSYVLALILSLKYLRKLISLKISFKSWIKTFFAGLIIVLTVNILSNIFSFNVWVELILFSVIALSIYISLLFLFKLVSVEGINGIFHKK